ncbi:hypothetical protein BS50DRAFT_569765 [Corynespora cassiicola Philippines]|uniref:Uncharacterized protein n=1 Tax=Corynespora cassiicola Philippines TaxID=1448308 RepID=A0A2T2P3L9_CORCC|nr:hypothetical protein BS50DRAFT_569765 [Corynespora cassiicola Philippines]
MAKRWMRVASAKGVSVGGLGSWTGGRVRTEGFKDGVAAKVPPRHGILAMDGSNGDTRGCSQEAVLARRTEGGQTVSRRRAAVGRGGSRDVVEAGCGPGSWLLPNGQRPSRVGAKPKGMTSWRS